ncbi:putative 2-dehydropantoate 2-reductase [Phlyctema vagabunda]|uniref:2-dehydropantoate 2-reductase n=1 Tax=Phlyctema vagabunda TaxID=108571 RepID=A0ABR4PPX0_9HELO
MMRLLRGAWLRTTPLRVHSSSPAARMLSTAAARLPDHVQQKGRVHVLGMGNLGLLFAHSLYWQTPEKRPPITLLLHRPGLLHDWNGTISIAPGYSHGGTAASRDGYDVELLEKHAGDGGGNNIKNLILTTKTINTVSALTSIKHRLTPQSTILFAQNGMGTIEEVNEKVFPDTSTRPNYLASVVSHGVYGEGPFRSVHAGMGTVSLGRMENDGYSLSTSDYLIQQVIDAPALAGREFEALELKRIQLQKLVVNAMINPLTVIFNCRNDALFGNPLILSLMQRLLAETSQVIRALPELSVDAEREVHFSIERLEKVVLDMAIKTGKNTSSMLQDVRAGKPTEIDYINGYLVTRGREVGIDCDTNRRLVDMVKRVQLITPKEILQYFLDATKTKESRNGESPAVAVSGSVHDFRSWSG